MVAALTAGLFGAGHSLADPVIVDGSFEEPAYGATGIYTGGGTGWTPSFMGGVAIVNGNIRDDYHHLYGVTPYGVQYLGLDPRTPNGFVSSDSQTISGFVKGTTYVLSLEVADSDGGNAPMLEVVLSNDAGRNYLDKSYDVPVGGPYGAVIDFTRVTTLFTSPVTGDVTLSLINSGNSFGGGDPGSISIDDVSIATLAPVPEPDTLALTLCGTGVVGFAAVRRRRRS